MTTEGYRNKPQFEYNPTLNKHVTPNVPKFDSNSMDNDNMIINKGGDSGCKCKGNDHDYHENHKNHEHKHCCCNHEHK